MATQRLTVPATWAASGRITTGASDTVFRVSDSTIDLTWAITAGDTAPTIEITEGHHIERGESVEIACLATERLWFVGKGGTTGAVTVS